MRHMCKFGLVLTAVAATVLGSAAEAQVTYSVTDDTTVEPWLTFHFTTADFLTGSGSIPDPVFDNCLGCTLTYSTSTSFPFDQFSVTGGFGSGNIQFASGSFGEDGTYPSLELYQGTLVVSGSPAPAPEPASWAMMLLGFGGIGFAIRRRKLDEARSLEPSHIGSRHF